MFSLGFFFFKKLPDYFPEWPHYFTCPDKILTEVHASQKSTNMIISGCHRKV